MLHIQLPPSKSLANRTLVTFAVEGKPLPSPDTSWSEDMLGMYRVLQGNGDAGAAGTGFRFGMAFWAAQEGKKIHLTGTPRLLVRPIMPLVEALRSLGAVINQRKDGSWDIEGVKLEGGKVAVDASVSSQFISALYLIAPLMANPLELTLMVDAVSAPYVKMTKAVMADPEWPVEADWSSAIVWALRASCAGESIALEGLTRCSLQGDACWANWGLVLGFSAAYEGSSLVIRGLPSRPREAIQLDLKDCPDLAQPLVAAALLMRREAHFTGLNTLDAKEIPRLQAMVAALKTLGLRDVSSDTSSLQFDAKDWVPKEESLVVDALDDHRMAFFWALIGLEQALDWRGESAVAKSYPGFWKNWNA